MAGVLMLLGFVCFVLGIFGVPLGTVQMIALGLSFTTAAALVGYIPKSP